MEEHGSVVREGRWCVSRARGANAPSAPRDVGGWHYVPRSLGKRLWTSEASAIVSLLPPNRGCDDQLQAASETRSRHCAMRILCAMSVPTTNPHSRPHRVLHTASSYARRTLVLVSVLLFPLHTAVSQVSRRDVVRGRVTTDKGAAVTDASVIITRLPDRAVFRTTSDLSGYFFVVIEPGTGDYMVYIAMDSTHRLSPYRARLRRTVSADTVFDVRAQMTAFSAQTLDVVKVQAERPTPDRAPSVLEVGTGAVEQAVLGVSALTVPEQRGDLAALAGSAPGLTHSSNGLSALGVGLQNGTTMNGMSFPGASVPRDIRFTTRVSTSTFDPARGWFGGAETAVEIEPGNMLRSVRASATVDNPALQSGDRLARPLGQQYASATASLGADGYAASDRLAYNVGAEVSRRTAQLASPTRLDAAVLERVGLDMASTRRALEALSAVGVPVAVGRDADVGFTTSTATLSSRVSTPEFVGRTNTRAKYSLGLVLYSFYQKREGVGGSPQFLASRQLTERDAISSAQILYSTLSSRRVVQSVRSAISISRESATPRLSYPSGDLLLLGPASETTLPNALLGFGGADRRTSSERMTWETQSRTTFYFPRDPRHLLELTGDVRWDQLRQDDATGTEGAFTFGDLDAFERDQPLAFSRVLARTPQRGGVWNGFLSLGDTWRPTSRVRVLFGLRAEGNYFAELPNPNPAITESFGVHNNYAPQRVSLSPRLGFQWRYGDAAGSRSGFYATPLGTLPFIPTGIVRGGIGRFTGFLSPDLMTAPSSATGLPGATVQIACVGAAAPRPNWRAYTASTDSLPSTCLPLSGSSTLGDSAPTVRVIGQGYAPSDSWRANLGWAAQNSWVLWSADATFAWNRSQPSAVDLNLVNTPRFVTSDEGRPVFVTPAGIVASTGAVSPTGARRVSAFGQVLQTRSDLSGTAQQVVITIVPNMRSLTGEVFSSVSYTLGASSAWQRGFDQSTFGSPELRDFRPTAVDTRHTIQTQFGIVSPYVTLTLFGRFASGQPFTPLIGSDVNGDGLANDRAFIFDAASLPNDAFARDLRSLLARAPAYARRCLDAQHGRAADANSCRGPWTAMLNARLSSKPLGWRDAQIALSVVNVPGALDRLVHGTTPHGWGNVAAPDPVLFRPSGFNVLQSRYVYTVNPRFGNSRGVAPISPFRVNLDVRLNLGPSSTRQLVRRLLNPGRTDRSRVRLDAPTLVARLRRSGPQPYREMLELADSLQLTNAQITALTKSDDQLRIRTDSVWLELATWMSSLSERFDESEVLARQETITRKVWEIARQHVQATLRPLLSAQQAALLPWPTSLLFTSPKPITDIRVFDYRDPG